MLPSQLKNLEDSKRHMESIERGSRSTAVHYADYQSLAMA
jgi:hypothetical protein